MEAASVASVGATTSKRVALGSAQVGGVVVGAVVAIIGLFLNGFQRESVPVRNRPPVGIPIRSFRKRRHHPAIGLVSHLAPFGGIRKRIPREENGRIRNMLDLHPHFGFAFAQGLGDQKLVLAEFAIGSLHRMDGGAQLRGGIGIDIGVRARAIPGTHRMPTRGGIARYGNPRGPPGSLRAAARACTSSLMISPMDSSVHRT